MFPLWIGHVMMYPPCNSTVHFLILFFDYYFVIVVEVVCLRDGLAVIRVFKFYTFDCLRCTIRDCMPMHLV